MLWLLPRVEFGADSESVTPEWPTASPSTPELTVKWGTGPVQAEPGGLCGHLPPQPWPRRATCSLCR